MNIKKLNHLYKCFELYYWRLFNISRILENRVKGKVIGEPDEILDIFEAKGYVSQYIFIPANAFIFNTQDLHLFKIVYPEEFFLRDDSEKAIRKTFREVWKRINETRNWLGITKQTRFVGEKHPEYRLVNQLELFIKNEKDYKPPREIKDYIFNSSIQVIQKFIDFSKDRNNYRDVRALF